jgi:hypothetical protein
VLIVLLVLAVRSAEVQATEDQQAKQALENGQLNELKQLNSELDETELRIDLIRSSRPDTLERLNKSREYRGHLEAELRSLKSKIAELDDALASREEDLSPSRDSAESNQRIETLTQQILLAEEALETKRKASNSNAKVTYSIIPHEGTGGTFRRPIFIVCSKDAMTIEPLGIRLERSDFVPPLGPGNPLDAAVLAIREYWLKHDIDGANGSPYPLIIIRPDGAEGYAISRRAMTSWEDEFGYELVEAEKELNFGEADPQLKSLVESAVAEARMRQRSRLVARPTPPSMSVPTASARSGRGYSKSESDQRPGLTASGSNGGFVINSAWEEMDQSAFAVGSPGSFKNTSGQSGSGNSEFEHPNSFGARMNPPRGSADPTGQLGFEDNHSLDEIDSAGREKAGLSGGRNQGSQHAQTINSRAGSLGGTGNQPGFDSSSRSSNSSLSSDSISSSSPQNSADANAGSQQQSGESCPAPLMFQHTNLAQHKGRNWAVPNKTPNATAYVRPIRVVCTATELEVRSPLGVEKRIPVGDDITQTVDPLINEIWRQIESWGMPGEKSYWKPELRISVITGGELNFEKLQGLLFESGIQVKETAK